MPGRFAMAHALVIATCIVTAAILAPSEMTVADVLVLIAGAGGTGAAIVLVVMTGTRRVGRMGRFVRAYLSSGN
jgi:type IV secretory pathway VirB2 component (pilin)